MTKRQRIEQLEKQLAELTERIRQLEARPGQVVMIPNENIERKPERTEPWPSHPPFLPPFPVPMLPGEQWTQPWWRNGEVIC